MFAFLGISERCSTEGAIASWQSPERSTGAKLLESGMYATIAEIAAVDEILRTRSLKRPDLTQIVRREKLSHLFRKGQIAAGWKAGSIRPSKSALG
jgi:hypothetical protein